MTEHKLLRPLDVAYLACIWIAGLSIVLMSLIIPWGVFARYVLGTGAHWPEPVAVLLMVSFTFLVRPPVTARVHTLRSAC